jgi:hypothetical protein
VPLAAGAGRGHRRLHGRGGRQASRVLPEGGFLWADDFWGDDALEHLTGQFARILPPDEHSVHDLPANHPVFRTMFLITRLPQIPSIRIWGPYRVTSERGAETAEVHFRGISDQNGRLMVLMTHTTDIQDAWEREGESPDFFRHFSPDGYAVGINVLLYTMSHRRLGFTLPDRILAIINPH